MAHTLRDKEKLLNRVRRLRGQVEAIEKALKEEENCASILHLIAASRGAISSLMFEVIEGHIRYHVVDPDSRPSSSQSAATQQLIDVLKTYLK